MKIKLSLLKAIFSEDMNMFRYKTKSNSSGIKKLFLPVFLGIIIMYSVGTYAYLFADMLSKANLTYIMLTLFIMAVSLISFTEGMYKSQGILFDAKDNDLLFSLPIEKKKIFFLRIFKLLVFQFIFNLLFLIPAFIIYIYFENPSINFYVISFIFLFLIPIIPTIFSSILGYIIKLVSSKFKAKKIIQTLLTTALMLIIFFLSFNLESFMKDIVKNATSINDLITKIYYPVGSYISLIQKFDFLLLIKALLINIIPLVLFTYIGSIYYFKIISKFSENSTVGLNKKSKEIKVKNPLNSLIKKEITRFFSSPVYMLNTLFGIFIILALTIGISIKDINFLSQINLPDINFDINNITKNISKIFCQLIVLISCMTSITSSSISLEGKSFNITKSLPVKEIDILLSKIITSNILTFPIMFISDFIFIFKFNTSLMDSLLILLFTITIPTFSAVLGLIINLKYPKLNFSNDTEVVKQSLSTLISTFIGLGIAFISTLIMIKTFNYVNIFIVIELIVFILMTMILLIVLKKYGQKRFKEINV